MIGELLVWIGKNGSSTICWPATCWVSLRKMSGIDGDVRGGVEPAAALLGELLQERVRAAARADRRERDPGGLHPREDLVVLAGARPAVGQQDDVAPRRRDLLQRLHRLVEARVDVRRAERVDARDVALQVADLAERPGLDDPVRLSSKATTPSSSRAVSAAAARRIASLPMSTLRTPWSWPPPPCPPLNVLQWQASIEPDLSITTTSAMSGSFCRFRTPMSTGSASSIGVFV